MFGRPIRLFSLGGIPIRLDPSWFLVAALIVWSLAVGAFPVWQPHLSRAVYWTMGAIGTLGLFLSIIAHELCHAVMARRHDIPVQGITLFVFGGVAEMGGEPPTARGELAMALAGPLASMAIGAVALALTALGGGWWPPVVTVLTYLGTINFVLAAFNLLPAFPLDGGRVFRALLWRRTGDLPRATRIATRLGGAFSFIFMILGALRAAAGDLMGGIWLVLIGLFLRQAASVSYEQVVVRHALEGEPVRRFMTVGPITVQPNLSLAEFLESYVYRYHHRLFPVQDNGRLIGSISTDALRAVPREEWPRRTVGAVAVPYTAAGSVTPETAALQALARMRQTGQTRLLVVENGQLAGVLSVRDLLDFLALKLELEK